MSAFFELEGWIWVVGNWILFKISLGLEISDKVWESYAWSKFGWLFLRNLNLATFEFWWIRSIPWKIMINHDQMMNITSKYWCWLKILKFDCMLTIIDFLPNIVGFQSSEQLSEQICDARNEIWHEHSWRHMKNHGNNLRPLRLNLTLETQNPSCRPIA